MENPIKIKSLEHLVAILDKSENVREFFIEFIGGGRSWKAITFADKLDSKGNYKLEILNEIDDTRQVLAIGSLNNTRFTNIGLAIERGAFYLWDDNENYDKSDVELY